MDDGTRRSTPRSSARLTLAEAVDALAALAATAGVDPQGARTEGLALAAAVAESAPRAATDWTDAAGGTTSTQDFFDAASRGRRWRDSPTAILSSLSAQGSPHATDYAGALAEVASAACELGEPTMRVIGNASVAAAAQLSAVPPAVTAHRLPDCRCRRRAGAAPSRARRPQSPKPPRAGGTRAQHRRAAGRARRPDRAAAGEARGAPAGRRPPRREAARRGRPEGSHHHSTPRLHGEPRHRQDDGGPAGQRHLPRPRPAVPGAARRGGPLRAGRRLPRPDGDQDGRGRRLRCRRGPVHRRGLQPDRDRFLGRPVRPGGGRHPGQGDGGPARQPRGDRGRLPGTDGRPSSPPTPAWRAGSGPPSSSRTTPTTSWSRS